MRSSSSLNAGGTLIAMGTAVRFPTELGMARTVDASGNTSPNFYAPRPIVDAEVLRLRSPRVLRLHGSDHADQVPRRAPAHRGGRRSWRRPGKRLRAERLDQGARQKCGIVRTQIEVPGGYSGKGRVIMFANNPIYRWQNHGEFDMVFNSILNWNDLGTAARPAAPTAPAGGQ